MTARDLTNDYTTFQYELTAAQAEIERLKAALKTIADTGLDNEGDGFADADSLIIVARKALSLNSVETREMKP